jgi:Lrp/AsnC family leucine-responsive transcriptional regulator
MSHSIDSTDRSLLNLLVRDAGMSAAVLASRIGETPANCLKRIADLTAAGYIAGYRAVRGFPDPEERPSVVVLLIERDRTMSGKDVLRSVQFIPEVLSCDVGDGEFDILLRIQVTSPERVDELESLFGKQVGVHSVRVVRPLSTMSVA